MRRISSIRALAALPAAVLAISSCGSVGGSAAGGASTGEAAQALGGQTAADALSSLYQQAQKGGETQVVVYSPDAPYLKEVFAAFSKRFPTIAVQEVLLTGTQLQTRVDEEFLSGKHSADLLEVPGDEIWRSYTRSYLSSYLPPTAGGLKSTYQVIGPKNTWVTPYAKLGGILYNTSLVKKGQAPKSYADLLQSRWKGQVVITDPRQIGATSNYLIELTDANLVSGDYIERFKAQNPVVVPHFPQLSQMVGGGEYPLGLPYDVESVLQDQQKGAPESLVLPPKEGAGITHSSLGVLNGAPHPSAARLVEAWMLTPEGQRTLASQGFYGMMPGSPSPRGFPALSGIKVIPEPGPADSDDALNKGIQRVNKAWAA